MLDAARQAVLSKSTKVVSFDVFDTLLVRPVVAGGSYLCWSDPRLLFGLGASKQPVQVTVYWPSGQTDTFESLAVDRYWRITEGGEVEESGAH